MANTSTLKHLAIICGGPSKERGISLNSARSLMDHLQGQDITIHPIYVDYQRKFYELSPSQLYSNTPSDFDFKLAHTARELSQNELIQKLRSCDLAFPVIHGSFGEDGQIQRLLEINNIPFVGPSSTASRHMFLKHEATPILLQNGYATLPCITLHRNSTHNARILKTFFKQHLIQRAVVKPSAGGSSIGVYSVTSLEQAEAKVQAIFDMHIDDQIIVEPFCEGREFTVVLLQNLQGKPVALIPTEIHISYHNNQIFDYRRKYLPTSNTRYITPPTFSDEITHNIQHTAEELFTLFGARDLCRVDGWVLPNGQVLFTDFNPISGMEQNSFVFRQSSLLGFTHSDFFNTVLQSACHHHNITYHPKTSRTQRDLITAQEKQKVYVIFGGQTAERQVSLMSGTNSYLKLRHSTHYHAEPFLWDIEGNVWHLPYSYLLNHTVEEIFEDCKISQSPKNLQRLQSYIDTILSTLQLHTQKNYNTLELQPVKYTLEEFIDKAAADSAFVFIGLHGGPGENGELQALLDAKNIPYNGSGVAGSNICVDKYLTGEKISALNNPQIQTAPKVSVEIQKLLQLNSATIQTYWNTLTTQLNTTTFIIKPRTDGCSAGVIKLFSANNLLKYIELLQLKATYIPENTFPEQASIVEMPSSTEDVFLIEAFIETDYIRIINNDLVHKPKHGWLELTVGVLETNGQYHSLTPSITVAEGAVLSLEEKFQGGTGINLTPPPSSLITQKQVTTIQHAIETTAAALKIENYARIDIFFNTKSNQTIIIEANSLPGLTASTVIYHQALAETPPLQPTSFLDTLITNKLATNPEFCSVAPKT